MKRKRSKLENNNTYKKSDEISVMYVKHLDEMGVQELPSSDNEGTSDGEEVTSLVSKVSSDKSDESSMDSLVHKSPLRDLKHSETIMVTPPDQIRSFRVRRSVQNTCKLDLFGMLSDEIVLMIMQWLPRQSLSDCALVCQRWRRIVYDESLWQRIDLTCMSLKTDHMGYVLQRNPVILRMAQAEVAEPMLWELAPAMENFFCDLQYLDLSMALIKANDLAHLLGMCTRLKKLSVEHCDTDAAVCASIAANTELEVLNMSQCYQLDAAGLEEILICCSELVELNLAWTRLNSECIDIVCKLVNENVLKLNLSGCLKSLRNSHVKELVSRCTCLTELDLSDCTEITENCVDEIMKHLCDIEELSFSRCYNILPTKYIKLQACKSLQFLNIFGLMPPKQLETFTKAMKSIQINKHEFSTVARPTVGIRRTSIWGLRVRD
ncbi:S-phase kinase-associated protein 2 isoform X2 [Macrosteles quadrilineatus]|uniref:S-phase kinase-associated protein 2 isoform X2 n=1 Tax=Macrosteles quadrilineatus TaxID=74068 RepID=UPI0023E250DB|nr:S-phase kinase-associated protein 2 isoform X2 [Macrosteles quadrilineatus]